jgi:adenine-specific DNA-methyltransferase
MATAHDTKIPLTSPDVNAERVARLRELFPEAFTEGKLDPEKLSQLLGDGVTAAAERYGLSWTGKSEAIKNIQTQTTGTLLPAPDESVNFDTTANLIIEGDNLETLKLLQGGYHGRVKMIYIDPPYNTGGDFIYPDNYKEGLADYLKFSGQVSGEGVKLTTNPETDGRYHSKWLTMMYPRLFLARNLLREDGVIFASIDDHEVHNLRAVMNEIFGEENFVQHIIWNSKYTVAGDATTFSSQHEHILCYARNAEECVVSPLPRTEEMDAAYKNPDNDPRGPWKATPLHAKSGSKNYTFVFKNGKEWTAPDGRWPRFSQTTLRELDEENRIWFGADGNGTANVKTFLSEVKAGKTPGSVWKYDEVGHTHLANEQLASLLGKGVFDNPKPVGLVTRCLTLSASNDDIILDFFGGSGTTAQAVLELNAKDGGHRQFILVQLPEPTERKDFHTIADITKERVRRVIKKLNETDDGKLAMEKKHDRGFKVMKLSSSNFKVWDSASARKDATGLAEQLKLMAHNVVENRGDDALLYELVLKSNLPLTCKITSDKIGSYTFYDVADGTLAICLERKITQETLRGIIARKPKSVICLDVAFAGNDQLKTNIVLEMKSHGIEFHTA